MRQARFAILTLTVAVTIGGVRGAWTSMRAQEPKPGHDHAAMQMHLYRPADVQWKDGPASLPAGARFVVLEGDPAKDGQFTMRLRLPDGYRIPPHYHGGVEHVTVVSGTFHVGMGATFDKAAAKPMPAGTFGYWPPPMRHFAWAEGETVLQLHGLGPWTVTYVNPADDPRKK